MASPHRLTRTADLALVRREGKRVRTALLEVRVLASLLHGSARLRVGLVVPKHRHTVVERNRLKRRLRALLAAQWTAAWQPAMRRAATADAADVTHDAVLYALPAAYAASFEALRADVSRLATRAAELA